VRVLVTGISGFLGRQVARRLIDVGMDVTGFDLTPAHGLGCETIEGDLRDAEAVLDAVTDNDVVCHLGAVGDVYLAGSDPALAAGVNVGGCSHIAAAAAASGTRVVYASTWEVYGAPLYEPIDEDHPCRPDHPYSITKLAGEQILLSAYRLQGVPVVSLRLGTAYGPGLRPNSVFRIFADRARRGEAITIQGDGSQGRQFTHTSDIAHAFELACLSDDQGVALNVVAPETRSIKELAELIVRRYPTDIRFEPARPGDAPPGLVSAARAGEVLGWEARTSFEDGLDELLAGAGGG
jgi:UDP-glucose 4-epimerase